MRLDAVLIRLCFMAPVALCSPLPMVLVSDLEAVAGAAHPPAPVAPSRPKHALPETIVFNPEDDEEDAALTVFDNSPMTPAATAQPSAVLASSRPISTQYLLSLARHPWLAAVGKHRGGGGGARLTKQLPADAIAAVETSSFTQAEMGMAREEDGRVEVAGIGMPCHYARLTRNHNDVLAVVLIFIFAAVVVLVETFSSIQRIFSRRTGAGPIRLHADTDRQQRAPLSVRAEATSSEKMPL